MRSAPAALLSPRSIAIVGASDDITKTASRPLRFLRAGGFAGTVYPIARRETVMGEQAFPSLSALPECPDHAFVLLPTEGAMAAVAECARLGIPAVTVLAGGFSEAGPEGAAREDALRESLRGTGTRLLGPNSIGLVNLHHRMVLTANAAFAEPDLPLGGAFVASQSGSMIGAILSRGRGRGLGFAGLVSVGAEVDLDLGSICAATLDDPRITSYLLFLETLRGASALRDFAAGAAARGKPVVAYKLGRSTEAAELAVSHTGALAGEDDVADAFLRDCGIARVDTLESLLEAPALLRRLPIRKAGARKPVVGVVTTTGGGAAMVVDGLGMRGVSVEGPAEATRARLAAAGIDPGHGRILDLTLAGVRPEVMGAALDALLAAPEYDLVVAVAGSSSRFQPELAVQPVLEAARGSAHIASFCVPEAPQAIAMLAEAGVPVFRTPEACADAIAAAFARREPRPAAAPIPAGGEGRMLDEAEAYELLAALGVPHAPCVALPAASAGREELPFPYPVAVKVLHPDILHKSDLGGVVLGVASDAALAEAAGRIVESVAAHRPGLGADRVLVQAMTKPLGEVLVGYRRDPQVGPIILLAAGGVLTEIYRDRSVRLAPVDHGAAREMIAEVRALRALEGYRGRPPGDMEALAAAIVAISRLAERGDVVECEINPLMVLAEGRGVMAVDAVIRLGRDSDP
ncbi:acetate--CoA ligase family protein [Pararoseomonas indoligenes]|uniref:Acetate--CoA ligase family protein n=1 Tax=Roseomonas indoligenes TaxID=2820811 RepID=A0A940MVZ5_9PROT|nr:acetate--CoA ligase family protein [Pararoseomonas indoligenes]MBP0491799.1 acetate--CoA ligase family protein [Pararoseomonas indoligenes]